MARGTADPEWWTPERRKACGERQARECAEQTPEQRKARVAAANASRKIKAPCERCGRLVNRTNMQRHLRGKKCVVPS